MAKAPVNTPVFSFTVDVLSISVNDLIESLYSSTLFCCSEVVSFSTKGCSGARTIYVAPKRVSGLVVNIFITSLEPSILKSTSAPTLFPIQFRCISFVLSGQLIVSNP